MERCLLASTIHTRACPGSYRVQIPNVLLSHFIRQFFLYRDPRRLNFRAWLRHGVRRTLHKFCKRKHCFMQSWYTRGRLPNSRCDIQQCTTSWSLKFSRNNVVSVFLLCAIAGFLRIFWQELERTLDCFSQGRVHRYKMATDDEYSVQGGGEERERARA